MAQKTLVIEHDPMSTLAEKVPKIRISGKTLVRIQRGQNDGVDIYSDNPKQTMKILRAFRDIVLEAIGEQETGDVINVPE